MSVTDDDLENVTLPQGKYSSSKLIYILFQVNCVISMNYPPLCDSEHVVLLKYGDRMPSKLCSSTEL